MKKTILSVGLFLLVIQLCQSQNTDSQKIEAVGLNLISFVPFIVRSPKVSFIIEPTILLNTSKSTPTTKYLVRLSIGYTSTSMVRFNRITQNINAFYVKAGQQFVGQRVVFGYNVILGYNNLRGKIDIQGNFFPDYTKQLPTDSGFTAGVGGYFGLRQQLSKSLCLYWTVNSSLNTGYVGSPKFLYIPGAGGRIFENGLALDFNLHLMYHFPKKTFGHSL